ncbi:uncharacterized protein BDZ83DRAFT_649043 [Colletotrichum acutatum]|uniref:Nephrocystin 3-like N-terminal domain-containing protein n=1 Tax=Glomerella acutata TaxID=27357 RepID=A0AAD8UUU8_GLOAC|nr:uncharacterized protein BDZ83DRAFT_649043 [Colletotrichum acutatum]KAK1728198.1 hypothetical protein BDZ83DRAFT_649043 [Colletotrichum acutatum]
MALLALAKSECSTQNSKKIQDAFEQFEQALYPSDAKLFRGLSLEDVQNAARAVEREQSERRALRNTRRLEPFFEALKTLGVVLEPLCQGIPFLCFAWAPIKLSIVMFIRLHADLAILSRLATNRDLVDREAASFEIVEAMDERERLMREAAKRENERLDEYARQVFEWLQLGVCDREQEDLLNDFQEARVPETCEWLMRHSEVMTWLDEEDKRQVLWLKGKPGSGKSTLVSYLMQMAPTSSRSVLMCCMSSELLRKGEQNPACTILKVFCAKMLRLNRRLLPYIYEEHVRFNSTLPLTKVRQITKLLVDSLGHVFLVVDGIDEYLDGDQVRIFDELSRLLKPPSDTADGLGAPEPADGTRMSSVKLFISSRETRPILREIKKRWKQPAVINLTKDKEHALVSEDISRFAKVKLRALHDEFDEDVLQSILESLMSKADGMFLWVHLIMGFLQDQASVEDLRSTIDRLPRGLEGV